MSAEESPAEMQDSPLEIGEGLRNLWFPSAATIDTVSALKID